MRELIVVSAFTDPISVPENGDPVTAETRDPSLQALANRTLHNKNRIDAVEGRFDADGIILPEPVFVTRYISPNGGFGYDSSGDQSAWTGQYHGVRSEANNATRRYDITQLLPRNAAIHTVSALVTPGAERFTPGNRMSVSLLSLDIGSWLTPTVDLNVVASMTDDGDDVLQWVTVNSEPELPVAVSAAHVWQIAVIAGNDAGTNKDVIHALAVTYGVQTLRNG